MVHLVPQSLSQKMARRIERSTRFEATSIGHPGENRDALLYFDFADDAAGTQTRRAEGPRLAGIPSHAFVAGCWGTSDWHRMQIGIRRRDSKGERAAWVHLGNDVETGRLPRRMTSGQQNHRQHDRARGPEDLFSCLHRCDLLEDVSEKANTSARFLKTPTQIA
jgi:hypothetical protein